MGEMFNVLNKGMIVLVTINKMSVSSLAPDILSAKSFNKFLTSTTTSSFENAFATTIFEIYSGQDKNIIVRNHLIFQYLLREACSVSSLLPSLF